MKLPMLADGLVPHSGQMLFIDRLTKYSDDEASGVSKIVEGNSFVDSLGRVDGVLYVELLAQLVAAANGYKKLRGADSKGRGFIAGLSDFKFYGLAVVGDELELYFKTTFEMEGVIVTDGTVTNNGEVCAVGKLKVFTVNDDDAALGPVDECDGRAADAKATGICEDGRSPIFSAIKGSLSRVQVTDDQLSASCEFSFSRDFLGFDGHFNETPILPGIVMLDIVLALTELLFGKRLAIASLPVAKFLKVILPGTVVSVSLTVTKEDGLPTVRSEFLVEDKKAATFIMTVQPYEGN